ncbi:flagellar biosynthetic protein FliR [Inquilinus sp. CAU 1745]|uniref:flagellar biosynthetic protein FliR n=1 Tax=Inquilinus sp. CAU 1745 TaxID=3140369 RepID=UPI00325A5783
MLAELLTGDIFAFLFVFIRIGAALMVLPGIGDAYVTPRIRLVLALLFSALLLPGLMSALPPPPDDPLVLAIMVAGEAIIGLFLGLIARFLLAALEVAGTVISFQASLANAFVFNPAMTTQGTLIGAFLTVTGLTVLFATDMHHLMLLAIADSYSVFPPGALPPLDDMANMMTRLAADSFSIGIRLSAPFLVIGMIFYLGLGLLNRLMPQMQIFFVAMPAQIMLGLIVMALTLSAGILFWLGRVQESLIGLVGGPV